MDRIMLQDALEAQNAQGTKDSESPEERDKLTLMTLHSSKGLEFEIVYLVGMEEETLPHKKTDDLTEECRLAYVGITRDKERLFMTYCKERSLYGKKIARRPSRFLTNIKKEGLYKEQDRTKFGHLSEEEKESYKKNFFSNLFDDLQTGP